MERRLTNANAGLGSLKEVLGQGFLVYFDLQPGCVFSRRLLGLASVSGLQDHFPNKNSGLVFETFGRSI
jgi:hypothetical protein